MKKPQDGHGNINFPQKNKENEAPVVSVQRSTIFGTVQELPNRDVVLPAGILKRLKKVSTNYQKSTYFLP